MIGAEIKRSHSAEHSSCSSAPPPAGGSRYDTLKPSEHLIKSTDSTTRTLIHQQPIRVESRSIR